MADRGEAEVAGEAAYRRQGGVHVGRGDLGALEALPDPDPCGEGAGLLHHSIPCPSQEVGVGGTAAASHISLPLPHHNDLLCFLLTRLCSASWDHEL